MDLFSVPLITVAAQSIPQLKKSKPGSASQIDWIEIKSITQMLSHPKCFNKDPARWSWNEIAFYKTLPHQSLFSFLSSFFRDTVSLLCSTSFH